jgi:hypothetical protein
MEPSIPGCDSGIAIGDIAMGDVPRALEISSLEETGLPSNETSSSLHFIGFNVSEGSKVPSEKISSLDSGIGLALFMSVERMSAMCCSRLSPSFPPWELSGISWSLEADTFP